MIGQASFKGSLRHLIRLSIGTKLLIFFLLLSTISFVIVGIIALINMDRVGTFAVESSNALGDSAASDSTLLLEQMGEATIKQKAEDVALQLKIYIDAHNDKTIQELQNDSIFRSITVQSVGQTGYTVVLDINDGTYYFHKSSVFENRKAEDLFSNPTSGYYNPPVWNLINQMVLTKKDFGGYYDWREPDGSIRPKYTWFAGVKASTADGKEMFVAATTYIDEFSKPAIMAKDAILAHALETSVQIDRQIANTRIIFIILFVVLLLLVAAVSVWLSRLITNPIKKLKRSSEIIGKGNLDYTVDVKTGDELEDLGNSFNKMALDLKSHIEDLRRTTAEKERMGKELDLARGIQQSFLPETAPRVPGFDLAALNTPALEVGGDFFDFIPVALDQWGLVIADVSGKGFPAALFMALSRTMLRANAMGNPTVVQTINRANNMISEEGRANMFVTLFYGVLDPGHMTLTYVNAGHNPPFVTDRKGGDIVMLAARGIALGIMSDVDFEEKKVTLHEGDTLLLYTDGVTEAVNRKGDMFGQEKLAKLVAENQKLPAQQIIKIIEQNVITHAEGLPQFDDITLMVVKVLNAPQGQGS